MTRLKTSSQRQRMDPGALSAAVERFAAHLAGLGYTPLTVVGYFDYRAISEDGCVDGGPSCTDR